MARHNRKCLTCGTSYSFCPDCSRADALAPSWKAEFCCEECMTVWTTATKFNMGILSKQEAREIIAALELRPVSEYAACVQRDLGVILAEEKKAKRTKKSAAKPQNAIVVEAVAEITNIDNGGIEVEVDLNSEEQNVHEVVSKEDNE